VSYPLVQARLVQHPRQTAAAVAAGLESWAGRKDALLAAFPQLMTEDGNRTVLALEERLKPCCSF